MTVVSRKKAASFFSASDKSSSSFEKGRLLEDLICYLFAKVPGITLTKRNRYNNFNSEEIDVAFWNDKNPRGLYFLENVVLVECKNWSNRVGSQEVSWFDRKLRQRGQTHGVMVAANGITGDASEKTSAHQIIGEALKEGRKLIVISREEILKLANSEQLVKLIKQKICELVVSGSLFI